MKIVSKTLRKYKYYFLSYLLIGVCVYFPMFFNGFVWDDWNGILNNTQIHDFNFSILSDTMFNTYSAYRQTVVVYNSLLYSLFGTNAFPYHLIQLLLHIITTSLLFVFFNFYFKKFISFILSLLFLIHPINAEAVLWISAAESQLFSIPGLLALILLQNKNIDDKKLISAGGLLLLSLLSYELGIFYILVAILLVFFQKSKICKKFLFLIAAILLFYCLLRILGNATQTFSLSGTSLQERLLTLPLVIIYYFKTILIPLDLLIWQKWIISELSLTSFIFPAIMILLSVSIFLNFIISKPIKKRPTLLFFSLWLLLGVLAVSHIVQLDMTVSDRWFYFGFIGFLGILGYILQNYEKFFLKYKRLFLLLLIPLLLLYGMRTFTRSFDWRDNFTLFTHDLRLQPDNIYLLYSLGTLYNEKGETQKAREYLQKVSEVSPAFRFTLIELGLAYENEKNYEKAAYYYKRAKKETQEPLQSDYFDINLLLARSLYNSGNYKELITLLDDQSIMNSSQGYILLFLRAETWYKIGEYEKALKDAEILRKDSEDPMVEELYNNAKEKVDQRL